MKLSDFKVDQRVKQRDTIEQQTDFGTVKEVKESSVLIKWNYTPNPIEYFPAEFHTFKPL